MRQGACSGAARTGATAADALGQQQRVQPRRPLQRPFSARSAAVEAPHETPARPPPQASMLEEALPVAAGVAVALLPCMAFGGLAAARGFMILGGGEQTIKGRASGTGRSQRQQAQPWWQQPARPGPGRPAGRKL